jgi:hypothetical protein
LATSPDRLDLYDGAAVACDRLGRADDALQWMAKKLPRLGDDQQHRYRYHANRGTFLAHRWFRASMNPTDRADLKAAVTELRAALALNPEAHFGREKFQLAALEYLLDPEARDGGSLQPFVDPQTRDEAEEAVKGLAGLVVLGAAWNSVDVFYALQRALSRARHASLQTVVIARLRELVADGGRRTLGGATGALR